MSDATVEGEAAIIEQRYRRIYEVSRIFSPGAPIDQSELFAGRYEQIKDIIMALSQKGRHVIIYGERGVGKTSLANVFGKLTASVSTSRRWDYSVNADPSDDFSSLWRKALKQIILTTPRPRFGFDSGESPEEAWTLDSTLPSQGVTPDDVRSALALIPESATLIIDEIDTITDPLARAMLAHTIKSLSDNAIPSKVILVGVADSVEELISEHRSVERALVQVRMPRMSREELNELMQKALAKAGMTITEDARNVIVQLSRGLPHYTHSLGLHSATKSIERDSYEVTLADVYAATKETSAKLNLNSQSFLSIYHKATSGTEKQDLHSKVLLACALAETDLMGTFAATDVKRPLADITGKRYQIASYQRHLNDFTLDKRGPVLKRIGTKGLYRYCFVDPMLPPFAVIQAIHQKILHGDALETYVLSKSVATPD